MPEALPIFRYHPDPVGTGAIEPSDVICSLCGRARGARYTAGTYGESSPEVVCPWCIADGTAAAGGLFFNVAEDVPDGVFRAIVDEVAERTPGYATWQEDRWLFHCDDGAAFLGPVGHLQLLEHPDALDMLRVESRGFGLSPEAIEEQLSWLHVEGDATAYLFRCLHCGTHLAYSDVS